jgi:hypothetical protein
MAALRSVQVEHDSFARTAIYEYSRSAHKMLFILLLGDGGRVMCPLSACEDGWAAAGV